MGATRSFGEADMADASAHIPTRRPCPPGLAAASTSRVSAAGLALAAISVGFFAGVGLMPYPDGVARANAQSINRPVGFADVVDKIKPAVISVRVKIDA